MTAIKIMEILPLNIYYIKGNLKIITHVKSTKFHTFKVIVVLNIIIAYELPHAKNTKFHTVKVTVVLNMCMCT